MVPVIVLQTIAANLGSMLTPIGNPQNLYLYNLSEMNVGEFLVFMLPYTVVSGVLLALTIFVLSARKRKIRLTDCHFSEEKKKMNKVDKHVCGFISYGAFGCGKDPAILYFACGGGCISVFIRQKGALAGGLLPDLYIYRFLYFYRKYRTAAGISGSTAFTG